MLRTRESLIVQIVLLHVTVSVAMYALSFFCVMQMRTEYDDIMICNV